MIAPLLLAALAHVATGHSQQTEHADPGFGEELDDRRKGVVLARAAAPYSQLEVPLVVPTGAKGETQAFLEFLRELSYDHRRRPEPDGPFLPTIVETSVLVSSIRSVSEVTMDYSVELFFREKWKDPRLNYENYKSPQFENRTEMSLHESYAAHLWLPDTFIPNGIGSTNAVDNSITHRSLLRLFREGGVLYSRRISLTAECPMDLTLYPFDRQICKLEIESYGLPDTEVVYEWDERGVQWDKGKVKLSGFDLEQIVVNYTTGIYSTGNYSRLIACFFLARSSGFCFLSLVFPATVVVVAAWVSLWMENEASFQDMISVILTMTFLIYSYNTAMPRVSYVKAMDVYLGACFVFVFFSLIKLAMIKYMRQRLQMRSGETVMFKKRPLHNLLRPVTAHGLALAGVNESNQTALLQHNGFHDIEGGRRQPAPTELTDEQARNAYTYCMLGCCNLLLNKARLRRFHLATQTMFPIGLVLCCSVYVLVHPSIYMQPAHICIP